MMMFERIPAVSRMLRIEANPGAIHTGCLPLADEGDVGWTEPPRIGLVEFAPKADMVAQITKVT
jgi:hypothetical protein